MQLFDWMQNHAKTNIASYSSYIKFVGRDSNSAKALEIYNSIKDESTRINVSVCNSTLSCLIKCGKFNSSLKLFNQMKQAGLVPDIITYSTVCYSNLYVQNRRYCCGLNNHMYPTTFAHVVLVLGSVLAPFML